MSKPKRRARFSHWSRPAAVVAALAALAMGRGFDPVRADDPRPAAPTPEAGTQDQTATLSEEDVKYFETRVRPLLAARCYACHSDEAKEIGGALRLDRAERLARGGDRGKAVVAGKPDESLLVRAVRYKDADLQMPPDAQLPAAEIAEFERWVARGAPFPPSDATDGPAAPKRARVDLAAARDHWAFAPLRPADDVAIDSAAQAAGFGRGAPAEPARGRIDALIRRELSAVWPESPPPSKELAPSAPAPRRTLVRRIYFDLVGLPPTPEEVETFLADDGADAVERLVDRLLASPQFGERWARSWLELARYCDVPEVWAQNGGAPHLYRDWVVRALNEDLPYDQFVTRQLAADQLEPFRPEDVAALGMFGLSPTYWKELKLAPGVIKSVVAEEWEERIEALSGALLGLTAACARCHDHKFEPITMRDYYALAGVFANVRQAPLPLLDRETAAKVGAARLEVKRLEADITRFNAIAAQDPAQAETMKARALEAKTRVDEIVAATPHYHDPLAFAVEDARLDVLPDGPDRTKIEYAPGAAQDIAMQLRGNPANPGDVVPRRFLEVLSPGEPAAFRQGSGRRELAEAIFHDAGPLAARVIVNRIWKQHFGRGLVTTPSNFGLQGAPPSHPALLDDLAQRFVEHGWSLKWLHREIVLSAAFQQSSAFSPDRVAADPDNRLLARAPRRRLDVESWRDAMLLATGELDATVGGPAEELSDAGRRRRTLYGVVKRRELADILRLFDFPDPVSHAPERVETTTPLQQLFVLNSDFLAARARALAARVRAERPGDPAGQTARAYALLYGRAPSPREERIAVEHLSSLPAGLTESDAWQELAEALLAASELLYLD